MTYGLSLDLSEQNAQLLWHVASTYRHGPTWNLARDICSCADAEMISSLQFVPAFHE